MNSKQSKKELFMDMFGVEGNQIAKVKSVAQRLHQMICREKLDYCECWLCGVDEWVDYEEGRYYLQMAANLVKYLDSEGENIRIEQVYAIIGLVAVR